MTASTSPRKPIDVFGADAIGGMDVGRAPRHEAVVLPGPDCLPTLQATLPLRKAAHAQPTVCLAA